MKDVIVIGAGPAGLACGIAASRAGLSCTIVEQGSIVDAIRRFPVNMTWFSTPELLEIGDVPFVIPTVRPYARGYTELLPAGDQSIRTGCPDA